MNQAIVRTRFAPSPTGVPHIGNTRTALYAFLLAKKYKGQFILRIEDTDQKRTVPGSLEKIYEIQKSLGLTPDEGPYVQTQRLEIYQKYVQELLARGAAYKDEGAIRIKMPKEGYTSWHDLVQGKISVPNKEVDDKVQLKIYEPLGWKFPEIAHVPLLLGPDRTKLSKRHGAKSVLEYRDEGYLPEAINNFLFYLGFSYQDNSALLNLDDMVKIFDETKIQKQNAIFDLQKLNHFNKAWIKRLADEDLLERVKPFLKHQVADDTLRKILLLVKERITKLAELDQFSQFFFARPLPQVQTEQTKDYLADALSVLEKNAWTKEAIESARANSANAQGWNRGEYFMALRLAVAGSRVTPPLTESMLIIGQAEILARLKQNLT